MGGSIKQSLSWLINALFPTIVLRISPYLHLMGHRHAIISVHGAFGLTDVLLQIYQLTLALEKTLDSSQKIEGNRYND